MFRFLREPFVVFRNMSRSQHLYYWVLPLVAGLTFTAMYFSGIGWMQEFIAPAYDREFGLLENLDAVLILCTLIVLIRMAFLPMRPLFKVGVALACMVTVFMFLEEIDYGLHWIEWMKEIPPGQSAHIRNIHNQGGATSDLKAVANVIVAAVFVILPYVDSLKRFRLVKMASPSKMILFTVIATVTIALTHQALEPYDLPTNGGLNSNQSELEEVLIYYTFFVYFREKYLQFSSVPELLSRPLTGSKGVET
jgi:hypothetical protein